MKRQILLSCLLCYSVSLFSQSELSPQDIGWRGKDIELHVLSDKENKQHCLFLVSTDSIKELVLNKEGGVVQTFTTSRVGKEKLLGGFIKDGRSYVYLYNSSDEVMHVLVLDDSSANENVIPLAMKKEKMLDKISCGDHFAVFTVNKKSS